MPPRADSGVVAADVGEKSAENAKTNAFLPQRHKEREGIQKRINRQDLKNSKFNAENFFSIEYVEGGVIFNTETPRCRDTE